MTLLNTGFTLCVNDIVYFVSRLCINYRFIITGILELVEKGTLKVHYKQNIETAYVYDGKINIFADIVYPCNIRNM